MRRAPVPMCERFFAISARRPPAGPERAMRGGRGAKVVGVMRSDWPPSEWSRRKHGRGHGSLACTKQTQGSRDDLLLWFSRVRRAGAALLARGTAPKGQSFARASPPHAGTLHTHTSIVMRARRGARKSCFQDGVVCSTSRRPCCLASCTQNEHFSSFRHYIRMHALLYTRHNPRVAQAGYICGLGSNSRVFAIRERLFGATQPSLFGACMANPHYIILYRTLSTLAPSH